MCVQRGGGKRVRGRDFFLLLLKEVDCKGDVIAKEPSLIPSNEGTKSAR